MRWNSPASSVGSPGADRQPGALGVSGEAARKDAILGATKAAGHSSDLAVLAIETVMAFVARVPLNL
jgi:hypothetical protein